MTRTDIIEPHRTIHEAGYNNHDTFLAHILDRFSPLQLPAKDHFENYLRHKGRSNHKPNTIDGAFTSIAFFLTFYAGLGKADLKDIQRSDLEAFIEHEQDRDIRITTVKTRMACIVAFLHWLIIRNSSPARH
ncbi:MAG: hypothetical protein A4E65_03076 [Syntrophorhabdus sp. PtaU1.Bin153]|nr:MAG: hypothetical protein A4E65_03076 [Syntrophorhabdus sp. PtaU1.Bin153]